MNKENNSFSNSFITSIIIEAIMLFLILSIFLCFDFYSRQLLSLNTLIEIAKTTLLLSVSYILFYRIFKSGYYIVFGYIASLLPNVQNKKNNIYNLLTDTFFALALILTTSPVRPILQKVYFEGTKPIFDHAMVMFDPLESMLILSVLGLPIIIIICRNHTGFARVFYTVSIILLILIVGLINNKPNYSARIFESRADWITRDWEKQGKDAEKALDDANTNAEKAVAYHWLGVSENRRGNSQKAIEYQLKAIEEDPNYGAPYSSLSLSYLLLGDYDKAKINADKCIELMRNYAWCYYALAGYYEYTGQKEDAYKNLKKALDLDPRAEDIQNTYEEFIRNNPQFK